MNNNQNINNTMLSRYADNLTNVTYITNPAIAREEEIKRLILTLLTPEKSAILVGKPGIGKTAIVEGLAYKIRRNEVPDLLKGYQIYRINVAALVGEYQGENRVLKLVEEIKTLNKIILFVDEIHTLIISTNEAALDLANMFKEGLSRGSIKMIGATTTAEYDRYIVRDKAFLRRFERIDVQEPTMEMCVQILLQTLGWYVELGRGKVTMQTVQAAFRQADTEELIEAYLSEYPLKMDDFNDEVTIGEAKAFTKIKLREYLERLRTLPIKAAAEGEYLFYVYHRPKEGIAEAAFALVLLTELRQKGIRAADYAFEFTDQAELWAIILQIAG